MALASSSQCLLLQARDLLGSGERKHLLLRLGLPPLLCPQFQVLKKPQLASGAGVSSHQQCSWKL
jgi:hypothetical protein